MDTTPVRRVVTGHDAEGHSVIVSDAATPHVKVSPHRPGVAINNLWKVDAVPAVINGAPDTADVAMPLAPAAGGIHFRVVEFGPESEWLDSVSADDAAEAFGELGAGGALQGAGATHPFMHRTETVDFALILSGEIHLVLDGEETLMRAGDVCVQRGTNHVWSNRGTEACRIAFVLIDGDGS